MTLLGFVTPQVPYLGTLGHMGMSASCPMPLALLVQGIFARRYACATAVSTNLFYNA